MPERNTPYRSSKTAGYELTRYNALRHGILSRYTILPWENTEEYKSLLDALVEEHTPVGPTEEHLVEEVAGILWRKRRLRMAENAAFRRELTEVTSSGQQNAREAALIHLKIDEEATADKTGKINSLEQDRARIERAIELLRSGTSQAYEKALRGLPLQKQKCWVELTQTRELRLEPFLVNAVYSADAEGLIRFLQHESHQIATRKTELERSELIRDQSFGDAFKPDLVEGLVRYEVHLDRKLERMIAMLIRLKELRGVSSNGED